MADITPDEFRGLAKVAGLRLLEEDVEPLTVQFNALREGAGGASTSTICTGSRRCPRCSIRRTRRHPHPSPLPHRERGQAEALRQAQGERNPSLRKVPTTRWRTRPSRSWRICCGRSRCRRWS